MSFNSNHVIELSSEKIVNRRNIKWIVHKIDEENRNGCNFKEPYVTQNIDSAKNMMLFASFLDEENDNLDKKLYYGHGEAITDGDGYIFPNVNIVGCATDAYVCDLEFDGIAGTYLVAEGYLQEDKCKGFVEQLQQELESGYAPKTSIEITKKEGNDGIVYESGKWTPTNRTPVEYSYNGSCFVVNPSDKSAILLELNEEQKKKELEVEENLKKEKVIVKSKIIELNELSYDDISTLICRAFRNLMSLNSSNDNYRWYWIHKLYPSGTVVFESDITPKEYYQTTYSVDGKSVSIGDVVEVEESWTPIDGEKQIEINSSLVKDILLKQDEKGGNKNMEKFEEINAKLDELTTKLTDSDSKVAELNSAIVDANKALEEKTKEIEGMTEELNTLREFKTNADLEAKKVEINSYFENEIKKNGFTEVELNSLKTDFVDKCDLDGLKAKEMELCVKKVKEIASTATEINSQKTDNNDLYANIRNTELATDDNSDLY